MPGKRGQITLFIIIGVVIVAVIAILLYIRSIAVEEEVEAVPTDISGVKLYIEKCLEETAKDAILVISSQGGHYIAPRNSFNLIGIYIPFYLYGGNVSIPTKEMIENELSSYIYYNLPLCLDFEALTKKGYNITTETPYVKATIGAKEVFFDVTYPITIKIEEQEQTISKFSTSVDSNLMKLYNAAKNYMEFQVTDPSSFAVSDAINISIQNDITFDSFMFDENMLLSFIDNKTMIKNQPLVFSFAVKFSPAEIDQKLLSGFSVGG